MSLHQKHNIRKSVIITVLIIVVTMLFVLTYGGFAMVDYAMRPADFHRTTAEQRYQRFFEDHPIARPWVDSVRKAGALRDTTILVAKGKHEHALYLHNPRAEGRVAVIVHGYTDSAIGMLHIGMLYERLGYNLLLPDLPAHGESDGDFIGMGWPDRISVERWIAIADSMFRVNKPTPTRLVLHGISMGAATTMNVGGDNPPQVNCYIEDCGYTSVWDEFRQELKNRFGLPPFPMLYMASFANQIRQGWSFKEASPLKQVARCTKPMLFIHGDADTYVPTSMVYPLYEAKPQPKQLWIARGSKHARSFDDHPEEYTHVVSNFINKFNR